MGQFSNEAELMALIYGEMGAAETVVARLVLETADTELLVLAELYNVSVAAVLLTASTIDGL